MVNNCKKIVAVHLLNDYSGSPKVLSQAINAFKMNNVEVELLTGGNSKGFLTGLVLKHDSFYYRRFNHKLLTLFSYLFSQISLFLKVLRYKDQDAVIYINTLLPFGAALAGKLIGKKVVYHIHETSITPRLLKLFLRKIVSLTASKIIFVSNSLAKQEAFKDIEQLVVYNALDSELVKRAALVPYSSKYTDNSFNVLMVCSLKGYKGVDQFVSLAEQLALQLSLNFDLVLNADIEEINSYFSKSKLPTNLRLHSRQTDLHLFYAKASLVVNLSLVDQWVETFGLTLLEAMAYGVPVIAPPAGGPTEVVLDGKTGFLISAYDIEALKDKILLLIQDYNLCMEMSAAARLRIDDFSELVFTESILSALGYTSHTKNIGNSY